MGSLGDSSAENRGSFEPYIRVTSIMGVPPGPYRSGPLSLAGHKPTRHVSDVVCGSLWPECTSSSCLTLSEPTGASKGVTGIFFKGGKVMFTRFFSWREKLFPGKKIPILVDPKQISVF